MSTPAARRLLAFYGDDFTGSTDALESLALAGLRTVLLLRPADDAELANRFPDAQCVGIAGATRSMPPARMREELVPKLRELARFGAPLIHYKVCSTFDSSPEVGSIGCVIDLARESLGDGRAISILAGVPALGRYTAFGHHFAAADGVIHRLDRHPTMARHPTTPMGESDLRRHLAKQTRARIGLVSILDLDAPARRIRRSLDRELRSQADAVLFDVASDAHLPKIGRLLWEEASGGRHFVVGSSGVGYALVAHWRRCGWLAEASPVHAAIGRRSAIVALSGSCSPTTQRQIEAASRVGFACIRAPADSWIDLTEAEAEAARAPLVRQALAALAAGRSPLVYSARGPDDPAIDRVRARRRHGVDTAARLGRQLGRLARDLVLAGGPRRILIAGGDTSSYAVRELDLAALEWLAPVAPGAPLCRGSADDPRFDGLEIALKGGQMGEPDYFDRVRRGASH